MSKQDFLLEIGCEELPASAQQTLPPALHSLFEKTLQDMQLNFDEIRLYAAPRRLAILIKGLSSTQMPQTIEKQGPALEQAYGKDGSPTMACLGFAKSCGVTIDALVVKDTPKGKRVVCFNEKSGENTFDLLPEIINTVISKLPISKPMRWNQYSVSFVRPVHWVLALFGNRLIHAEILGLQTTQNTFGHRFHHPKAILISRPEDYSLLLYTQGFVVADFEIRKKKIEKGIRAAIDDSQHAVIKPDLLNEVTALVEWPVVLKGHFDQSFLSIPKEVLITAMETHQKCFPVENTEGQLQPTFILVSNIQSKDPAVVIQGNERVIHARLSDAVFFYQQDCKTPLTNFLLQLDHVIFQQSLGSLGDKTKRITKLAVHIAKKIGVNVEIIKRAATLCKCDLLTEMVSEFPSLQGVMGGYYAQKDGESNDCVIAIKEHYWPKFSGDMLPSTIAGCCIALADRLDTLVGIIGINKTPAGDKDPFALRRAAQGVLRILIEKSLDIELIALLKQTQKNYDTLLNNELVIQNVHDFIMARLKSWYIEQGVSITVFESVNARHPTSLLDFDRRLKAVLQFQKLPEAESLSAANKRVGNILRGAPSVSQKINNQLFDCEAERELAKQLFERTKVVDVLYEKADYEKALTELSSLKTPIDRFFDNAMIMVEDKSIRQNRLALLTTIHSLFTKVADISLLS